MQVKWCIFFSKGDAETCVCAYVCMCMMWPQTQLWRTNDTKKTETRFLPQSSHTTPSYLPHPHRVKIIAHQLLSKLPLSLFPKDQTCVWAKWVWMGRMGVDTHTHTHTHTQACRPHLVFFFSFPSVLLLSLSHKNRILPVRVCPKPPSKL